ncbi:HD domain-containing protein [Alloacidobacterium dinghuense]|uniref:HD domain-containing protein n=1 Tax=Alloacidobacterium dinghuense TaxID=2763107 RepID=A0A7G8BHU8_9BACT|nr:HD domain-containing protein [Alloacidobacterium dinghuense]QNI32118.1 HD domain-containing protein [Alloacidobacterium dinghuense]
MKDLFVGDLGKFENQVVTGFFAVAAKQVRSKKDGAVYFAMTLCDSTGQIECRMWEVADAQPFESGDVVKARGQISRYQDRLQLTLDKIRRANPEEYDLGDFVPKTSRDIEELWAELNGYVSTLTNAHLQALLRAFIDDPEIASALKSAPAAKSMHHAWVGGLLEHVVSLLGISDLAARHYPEINRDLLLTGVVLHDIGKLHELRWGTSFDYTLEGQLIGHISIGISMVEKKLANLQDFPDNLRVLVEHIILSHHGKYEFGSPKLPMIPEALLLHYLDDLDAKMQTMRSEFARAGALGRAPGQMTEWVRALERPLLNTAGYLGELAPTTEATAAEELEPREEINALPAED